MARKLGTEAGFQDRVRDALKKQGVFVAKWPGGQYGNSGMPDHHYLRDGLSVYAELKKANEQLTPLQHNKLWRIAQHGGLAMRIRFNDQEGCDLALILADRNLLEITTCTLEELWPAIVMCQIYRDVTWKKIQMPMTNE